MQWLQVRDREERLYVAARRDDRVVVLYEPSEPWDVLELLERTAAGLDGRAWLAREIRDGRTDDVAWSDLENGRTAWRLTAPLVAPEIWGAGVTYQRSMEFRDEGTGVYDHVYTAKRPELFFKASSWRAVGHTEPIGARSDSQFTAAEPELAVVLDRGGRVLGYTLANDVSAWDIERENALYLPQSKIYRGCFSFGPVIVTPDEIDDPAAIELTCTIERGGREIFRGSASTAQMRRTIPDLVGWLLASNEIRTGTVLSTGTGIIQPAEIGLEPGDVVAISSPVIGVLRNPVERV